MDVIKELQQQQQPDDNGKPQKDSEKYRDHVATVDDEGKRIWVYPKKPSGNFYKARTYVSWVLLAFLFGAPFIKIGGQPLLLFNILERKFIIFGVKFWPQDFHLFALSLLTFIVFVILFTVVFGRLFCGWACPQTIFLEMVFRKIEYFIEGDSNQQRKLNKAPWNWEKIWKKGTKLSIFYALSFLIGNTFLAYIIGVDELFKIITDPPSQHLAGLTAMIFFSTVFFWVFSWFREQACVMVCPYGRLQGVLLDQNSIVVSYDFNRGEPRGKRRRNVTEANLGDCIDCTMCVQVCPTGIDIRNGTQLECVNCTACIDACDEIMDKVEKPRGLIRYSSYNGIVEGQKLKLTPRIVGYTLILTILLSLTGYLLTNRVPVETSILRTPGTLYQETPDGQYQNLYNIKVVNKTADEKVITLKLNNIAGSIFMVSGDKLNVPNEGFGESAFFVRIPKEQILHQKTPIEISVIADGQELEVVKTAFFGPEK
ncbi:MAG: cytochrome c oxidase accessory protein CcoG [Calditrichia bacterium]|nr:cytochrome c oxidase accessory protein CcoG [Calditrichota bacterium]